jgi:hypothetical protein
LQVHGRGQLLLITFRRGSVFPANRTSGGTGVVHAVLDFSSRAGKLTQYLMFSNRLYLRGRPHAQTFGYMSQKSTLVHFFVRIPDL